MKYDDASWHYGGDFPSDLPAKAGATHIGMFVTWALLAGLENSKDPLGIETLKSKGLTPGEFVMNECDEKFVDAFLNTEGNEFAKYYYFSETGMFNNDYASTLASELPSIYHVGDSWTNYDKLKPIIDRRFAQWRSGVPSTQRAHPKESFLSRFMSKFTRKD
jgi:hypothetical protein